MSEIIDNAIIDLRGKYPFPSHGCLHKAGSNYFTCDSDHTSVIGSVFICTRKEFENRKVMLAGGDKDNNDWYDYEKQIGNIFPRTFDAVQFKMGDAWVDGEVVGMSSGGGCVIEYSEGFKLVCWEGDIRPMDWDKNRDCGDLYAVVSAAIYTNQGKVNTVGAIVDAILAAGYRKCDNNTPPTKE